MSVENVEKIEKNLIEKITIDFEKIVNYVETHPYTREHTSYDKNNELIYMSYTRPLFVQDNGSYLILMVVDWKKEEEIKSFYLWNGQIYNTFEALSNGLKAQYLKFKNVIDLS